HLVFLRTDFETSFKLLNENHINIWYIKDFVSKRNLIVPDKQMEDFMLVINAKQGNVPFINPDLAKGDKVVVTDGPFKGIEGELIRVEDKSKVVVNLQGIVAISIEIDGVFLEKIK
ncbi:MAG: KOW motif-containing protein, partial [Bacteroidales bacterium]